MTETLSAFEKSLRPAQLAEHLEREARTLWEVRKGMATYTPEKAIADYVRQRPEVYQHYTKMVQRESKADVEEAAEVHRRQQTAPVSKADDAYEALVRMAKGYVRDRRAPDVETAMPLVLKDFPEVYRNYTAAVNAARRVG
jgi:hypothetical protein